MQLTLPSSHIHAPGLSTMQLLHISHHSHHAEEQDPHSSRWQDQTFTLRLVAIFVILVAGLLGVIPPLVGSWLSGSPNSTTSRVVRAGSGGIILALALVRSCQGGVSGCGTLSGVVPACPA